MGPWAVGGDDRGGRHHPGPAPAANVGVAIAAGNLPEFGGASVQLASNVAGLLVAGTVTVALRHRGRAPR